MLLIVDKFMKEFADQLAVNWLDARRELFRIVMRQIIFSLGLQVLAGTGSIPRDRPSLRETTGPKTYRVLSVSAPPFDVTSADMGRPPGS